MESYAAIDSRPLDAAPRIRRKSKIKIRKMNKSRSKSKIRM
jgi:hypothetical protein